MAQRKTRKAGLPQSRHSDPKLQRTLDAIIERLEVIDGLRGDALDRAVTYRDLTASGFTVTDNLSITNTPGPGTGGPGTTPGGGDGPGIGPAAAPTNLAAAETFLAILLTWDNPSFNLQHIEVWRADTDNLSLAVMIGTTVSPQYVDYVGASASYYYWVRAVGTDGTFSAFNDTQGTLGTTGVDPSDWELNLNISASNLDAALAARIDLIDVDGLQQSILTRLQALLSTDGTTGRVIDAETDIDALEASYDGMVDGTDIPLGIDTLVTGATATANSYTNAQILALGVPGINDQISNILNDPGGTDSPVAGIRANASDILNLQATIGALDAEGGQTWDFLTDLDGWTASNASLTHSGEGTGLVRFTPSGANPYMSSDAISIGGGIYTQVVARVRRNAGGGTWEGKVSYSTAGHGIGSYYKLIPDPTLLNGQWQTLTWDMATVEGASTSDWVDSTITALQLELVSDAGGSFDVDWIIIAKFSTTAIAEAINAVAVSVEALEDGTVASNAADIALLNAVVDVTGGPVATATALSLLETSVNTYTDDTVEAEAARVDGLLVALEDPVTGLVVTSTAYEDLVANVNDIDNTTTAQASSLTQLVARMSGSYASIVNPLTTVGENFGTDYSAAELQAFNVGGRTGVCARVATAGNASDSVYRHDGARIQVNPNDIYEVKFSVYHGRATDAGTFFAGLSSYVAASGGSGVAVRAINDRVAGTTTTNPYWLSFAGANHDEEWLDVTCYILGADVDASVCPNMLINGSSATTGYAVFNDGFKVVSGAFVHLRFQNWNASPYGDGTETTTYVTDLQVRRIDSAAENYAALQVQANVTANDIGELDALYAVQVEVNANGNPYVTGFGLAASVRDDGQTVDSAFGIRADQFFITSPSNPVDTAVPFSVDLVDGVATVGIKGELIVDGSIRATSLNAKTIGAEYLNVTTLDAVNASMGVLIAGTLTTKGVIDPINPYYDPPDNLVPKYIPDIAAYRVEIEDTNGGNAWPIWYGTGAKSAGNGLFYVTDDGDVIVKGLLDAGMIKQSYFTPADNNSSFRIACDYPSNYSSGLYTGKKAHIFTIKTLNKVFNSDRGEQLGTGGGLGVQNPYTSTSLTFYSPTYSGTEEYGRLGTFDETLLCRISSQFHTDGAWCQCKIALEYQYDNEGWKEAWYSWGRVTNSTGIAHDYVFVSRPAPTWGTLSIRLKASKPYPVPFGNPASDKTLYLRSLSLGIMLPNFGYADLALAPAETGSGAQIPQDAVPGDGDRFRSWL